MFSHFSPARQTGRTGRAGLGTGLSIRLDDYLKLLKWTARLFRTGQRQTIPQNLEAILDRLELDQDEWSETIAAFETSFCHAVDENRVELGD